MFGFVVVFYLAALWSYLQHEGIRVSGLGLSPSPMLGAWSLSPWTAREVPGVGFDG